MDRHNYILQFHNHEITIQQRGQRKGILSKVLHGLKRWRSILQAQGVSTASQRITLCIREVERLRLIVLCSACILTEKVKKSPLRRSLECAKNNYERDPQQRTTRKAQRKTSATSACWTTTARHSRHLLLLSAFPFLALI